MKSVHFLYSFNYQCFMSRMKRQKKRLSSASSSRHVSLLHWNLITVTVVVAGLLCLAALVLGLGFSFLAPFVGASTVVQYILVLSPPTLVLVLVLMSLSDVSKKGRVSHIIAVLAILALCWFVIVALVWYYYGFSLGLLSGRVF